MRIRSVKPEFWSDEAIADLSDGAKLVFVGTWNLADDSGLLRWKVRSIAAELFRYERPDRREKKVARALDELVEAGMLRVLECGLHAFVPNLTKHQRIAGREDKQVHTYRREHEAKCVPAASPSDPRGEPRVARARVREGREGEVDMEGEGAGGDRSSSNGRADTIAALRALLADPSSAEAARRAARRQLEKLGVTEGESDG